MFRESVPNTLHGIINVVGHWPNKVFTTCIEDKTNEGGISPNIVVIGIDEVTNLRALWTLTSFLLQQYGQDAQVQNYCFPPLI